MLKKNLIFFARKAQHYTCTSNVHALQILYPVTSPRNKNKLTKSRTIDRIIDARNQESVKTARFFETMDSKSFRKK